MTENKILSLRECARQDADRLGVVEDWKQKNARRERIKRANRSRNTLKRDERNREVLEAGSKMGKRS